MAGYKRALDSPSSGEEALEFGGGLGDDDRAVWATPHGIPLNSLARVSWHTHKIRGRASIQFHRIPSSERSRLSHFNHLDHSQPDRPPGPPSEYSIALPPGHRTTAIFLLFFYRPEQSLQWPWLWWSMATRIADGRLCMSPPSSPGDVSVSQRALGNQRERASKKKHRPLDRAFLRLTGRSAGRPACNSIGSRTSNTHFQL